MVEGGAETSVVYSDYVLITDSCFMTVVQGGPWIHLVHLADAISLTWRRW